MTLTVYIDTSWGHYRRGSRHIQCVDTALDMCVDTALDMGPILRLWLASYEPQNST